VRAALKKDLATSKAPSDVMALLEERAAAGSMTLEDFESLRTSLSRTQRSASDGQERHAAGVIRNQIEAMPLQPAPSSSRTSPMPRAPRRVNASRRSRRTRRTRRPSTRRRRPTSSCRSS
jgi:hypothetical protein